MSDFKSKLPDFKELSSMTSKLFKGFKASVEEIVHDYKQKRDNAPKSKPHETTEHAKSKKTEHHSEPVKKRTTKKTAHDDHDK